MGYCPPDPRRSPRKFTVARWSTCPLLKIESLYPAGEGKAFSRRHVGSSIESWHPPERFVLLSRFEYANYDRRCIDN